MKACKFTPHNFCFDTCRLDTLTKLSVVLQLSKGILLNSCINNKVDIHNNNNNVPTTTPIARSQTLCHFPENSH